MNKKSIIKFINKLIETDYLDNVSVANYQLIKNILEKGSLIKIKNFNKIIRSSEDIINLMYDNYQSFQDNFFTFVSKNNISYQNIRNELFNSPTFDENQGIELKEEITKIKNKYSYKLVIDNITINIHYYSNLDESLFLNLAKILYLFIKTFGVNLQVYNNFNIRFLLIDFPRILDNKYQINNKSFENLGKKGYYNNSSGLTNFHAKELVVTRKSGIIGLLIHELIHMLGLDFCLNFEDMNHTNLENWTSIWVKNNNINDSNNIRSFIESICNTNSSYFLSIYNAIYLASNKDKLSRLFKYFFYIETIHCYVNNVKLLNYFNFDDFDSFFKNTNNKIFYQNALVFEYVTMRFFLIYQFYKLILKYLIKNKFNQLSDKYKNYEYQERLNNKLVKLTNSNTLKTIFNNISKILKNTNENNIYIEYFSTNLKFN